MLNKKQVEALKNLAKKVITQAFRDIEKADAMFEQSESRFCKHCSTSSSDCNYRHALNEAKRFKENSIRFFEPDGRFLDFLAVVPEMTREVEKYRKEVLGFAK